MFNIQNLTCSKICIHETHYLTRWEWKYVKVHEVKMAERLLLTIKTIRQICSKKMPQSSCTFRAVRCSPFEGKSLCHERFQPCIHNTQMPPVVHNLVLWCTKQLCTNEVVHKINVLLWGYTEIWDRFYYLKHWEVKEENDCAKRGKEDL